MMKIFFSTLISLLLTVSVATAGEDLMECAGDLAIDALPIYSVEEAYDLIIDIDEKCDKEVFYAAYDAGFDPEDPLSRFSIITGHLSTIYGVFLSFVLDECDCEGVQYDSI